MDHEELVAAFGQTVGIEKAEALIADAIDDLGIERRESYSHHEVADVCETIRRSSEGYVRLVATELRVAERARRRFDALLDEISDPVVTVSFEDRVPVVAAMNPAFEETFGYDASVVGEPLPELLGVGEAVADEDAIDRWLRADRAGGVEIRRRTADGEVGTFLFRSVVGTRETGDLEGYGIYTDITDRKRRERRLQHQNEQLERFASVVSHDLRNPLGLANGHLELALETTRDEDVRDHLRTIADAHDRMGTMIENLLALARRGQTVESASPIPLREVVYEAWSSVSTTGAALELAATDASIEADRPRLRQLFENLFRNAVEYGCPEAGPADDAANTAAESAPDAEVLESGSGSESGSEPADDDPGVTVRVGLLPEGRDGFYVADDGPGIEPAAREKLFDHGYTTGSEGVGFGLAIVKAIADAHEWSISVTEGWAGGARFEVEGASVVADSRP